MSKKIFCVGYDYIEKNADKVRYIDEKYLTADDIAQAVQMASARVPENQRIVLIREEGEAIE